MLKMNRRDFLGKLGALCTIPFCHGLTAFIPDLDPPDRHQPGWTNPWREDTLQLLDPDRGALIPAEKNPPLIDLSTTTRASLMAVGDVMMHSTNIQYGFQQKTGRYEFAPYFQDVAPLFKTADWVIGNLETRLAGRKVRYTGYPMFNAPDRLARDLKNAGFTMMATANNHCLDRGPKGIVRTNEALDAAGLLHTGTFLSPEDHETVRLIRKGNMTLGVFAYTYGTNGLPIPRNHDYMVNLIDFKKIEGDFDRAKKIGVDFIVCCVHFGVEYARYPGIHQKRIVNQLFDLGADIILGSHPHVVQPYEVRTAGSRKKVVIYSLGNFIANQGRTYTDLGLILKIGLYKDASGRKDISEIDAIPTRILRTAIDQRRTFRVLPIRQVLAAADKYRLPRGLHAELIRQQALMDKHVRSIMTG